ncbi:MAG: aldo/keto reductase [Phycisphaerales bacterium]
MRRFGKTDLMVSPLGFGGAPIGVLDTDAHAVRTVLSQMLDSGANVIDTAACYYGSEEVIGRAIAHRRSEFVLITKCGHTVEEGDARPEFSPAVITESIDRSLTRLRSDVIDVVLLHSCSLDILKQGDALAAAVAARDAGKVRFVGYSGDNEAAAWACTQPDIAVLQTSVSICDQANIENAIAAAQRHDVGVMAKRPIANAAWKTPTEQYERYQSYAQPYCDRFAAMDLKDPPDGETWASHALRFTLSVAGVHTAIIGTTRLDHVRANVEAARRGRLANAEVKHLRDAFTRAQPEEGWSGLT